MSDKPVGFNGGYNEDGTWRWHKFNPDASPLEKKQVELDCMTRLKVIQEERTSHWRSIAEDKWQPIETAPHDGTIVLGVTIQAQRPTACITWFTGYQWLSTGKPDKFVVQPHGWWPTHWMPLPPPPEPAKVEVEEK